MIEIGVDRRWRVSLEVSVDVPIPADHLWRQLRNFERFACVDIFHRRVIWVNSENSVGGAFFLEHRFLLWRVMRIGRVLTWREGEGYSFSDLSGRRPQAGFPHVYAFRIRPLPAGSRVTLRITGRWTATWIPRSLVRVWFRWILLHTREKLRNSLLEGELRQRGRRRKTLGSEIGHPQVRPAPQLAGSTGLTACSSENPVDPGSPPIKQPPRPTRRSSWG